MFKAAIGIIIALGIALTFTTIRLNSADDRWEAKHAPVVAERDILKDRAKHDLTKIGALEQANTVNVNAVNDLAERLAAVLTHNEKLDALLGQAEQAADTARRDRATVLAQLEMQQETDYASQDCADWGGRAVCAAVTARVSEQWRRAAGQP